MADTAVPSEVAEAAARAGLGELVRRFDRRKNPAFFLSAYAGLLLMAVIAVWNAARMSPKDPGFPWEVGVLVVILLVMAGTVVAVRQALRTRGEGLYLYAAGLVHHTRAGATAVFRWADVVVLVDIKRIVSNRRTVRIERTYTLQSAGGGRLELTSQLDLDVQEIGELVVAGVMAEQLPRRLAELRSGSTVAFGPIAIDAAGLTHRNKRLPWSDASSAEVGNGVLVVRGPKRSFCKVPLATVPNYAVALSLIDALVEAHASAR